MIPPPEARAHGDAWCYFRLQMQGRQYGEQETYHAWLWFLAGWLDKAKQQQHLKGRR